MSAFTTPPVIRAALYLSGDFAAPQGDSAIPFNTVAFDNGGFRVGSNAYFTIPSKGRYHVTYYGYAPNTGVGPYIGLYLIYNDLNTPPAGTAHMADDYAQEPGGGFPSTRGRSIIAEFNRGDTIRLGCYNNRVGGVTINGGNPLGHLAGAFLSITKID